LQVFSWWQEMTIPIFKMLSLLVENNIKLIFRNSVKGGSILQKMCQLTILSIIS
jgi:hypothetical protein